MRKSIVPIAALLLGAGNLYAAETGVPQSLVSVSQYTDVQPGAPYFGALQSLTERYGVSNGFKGASGVEFRADKPLSRADMIMLVHAGLDQVSQLAELTTLEMPPEKRQSAMRTLSILQGAKCKSMGAQFESVAQIKDLKPTDEWYEAAQNLVEKWSIRIATSDGQFGPTETISTADAHECLKIFSPNGPAHKPPKLTRGDFAIMLNQAMDQFNEELGEATAAK